MFPIRIERIIDMNGIRMVSILSTKHHVFFGYMDPLTVAEDQFTKREVVSYLISSVST